MMMWGWVWPGTIFGSLFMVLVLAIAAIVLLVRSFGGTIARSNTAIPIAICPTPMDILNERFARGEIDKKRRRVPYTRLEFRRHPRRRALRRSPAAIYGLCRGSSARGAKRHPCAGCRHSDLS
jgi:putative membrane protein